MASSLPPSYSQVEKKTRSSSNEFQDNNSIWQVWYKKFVALNFDDTVAKEYATIFVNNEVQINMIPDLNDEVLKSMGINKAGHRMQILRLKPAQPSPNSAPVARSNQQASEGRSQPAIGCCGRHPDRMAVDKCHNCKRLVCIDCRRQFEGFIHVRSYCRECSGCTIL